MCVVRLGCGRAVLVSWCCGALGARDLEKAGRRCLDLPHRTPALGDSRVNTSERKLTRIRSRENERRIDGREVREKRRKTI
eukprot:313216-Rhodomonas_salina.1